MTRLKLSVEIVRLQLSAPFRISGFVFEHQPVVVVTLRDGVSFGRGEAAGVYYLGDTAEGMRAAIEEHRARIEAGIDRKTLQQLLPAGGARNAIDCALWELEAARARTTVWRLAGLDAFNPLKTTFTLGADSPEAMADGARKYAQARCLKVKLTGELQLDIARVRAVRAARPEVWIGVDANQGYSVATLPALIDELSRCRISLLEQPIARGHESDLQGLSSPIPIAADESALTLSDLPSLPGRFNIVNIKLDKCGGLTEGLAMAKRARDLGLGVMVGNMIGTSLAMAPGCIVGQYCDVVDLDGPIFLQQDRKPGVRYHEGKIWCGEDVWGGSQPAVA
jgi:L-alanine-DL-glutamate epimerase-like enolase superfamily enzyme